MVLPHPMPSDILPHGTRDLRDIQCQITATEITRRIRKSNKSSATGEGDITHEMIDLIIPVNPGLLTDLFNELLKHQGFPAELKYAKWVLIPKPERTDLGNPKNLRPNSLLSSLGKIMDKIQTKQVTEVSLMLHGGIGTVATEQKNPVVLLSCSTCCYEEVE